ncbi:hypothetical protein SAMN04488074_10369 [Lentzea albidocapillata subsp. violacea]|uniref:Uncharacterized protein n=2 Tax=Lentzea albidocapillata TaxID=40571 RepID=A0A1G8W6S0_9PSEU|nr:hypothetical protein SAMN04488074_10369 [Lentzea albidocapillata subsp. violacea]
MCSMSRNYQALVSIMKFCPEDGQALPAARTSHLVSPFTPRTWRVPEVLCNTESMRATYFEFFYGTRTPAPVVV